ncbi:heme exporter protein CcmD [Cupriavidus sp. D384]|nr:heme exporter protein CcmD [Cupriavidus sp. D384]
MSGHAAYIAGAFGVACLAIVAELFWLARRGRQRPVDPDDTP